MPLNRKTVKAFMKAGGDAKFRYSYPLTNDSLVLDLGGYKGEFAEKIFNQYGCSIEVYEPVAAFYNQCVAKFRGNDRVAIKKFGVADKNTSVEIGLAKDGSSVYVEGSQTERIDIVDIVEVIGSRQIALLKINVEGPEFEIMERIITLGLQSQVRDFQIQFHDFDSVRDPIGRREAIQQALAKTHRKTYDFPFVWENWTRND